ISSVADLVSALTIDPESERGSTNTGDAIARMTEEFTSARHDSNARKVGIILTDGLATAPANEPEAYAVSKASTLKANDVTLFTIGLGASVNRTFLETLASDVSHMFV